MQLLEFSLCTFMSPIDLFDVHAQISRDESSIVWHIFRFFSYLVLWKTCKTCTFIHEQNICKGMISSMINIAFFVRTPLTYLRVLRMMIMHVIHPPTAFKEKQIHWKVFQNKSCMTSRTFSVAYLSFYNDTDNQ